MSDLVSKISRPTKLKFKGAKYCAVEGCQSYNWNPSECISFFRIPKDEERRMIWLTRAKREDLLDSGLSTVYSSYRLCSAHFEDSAFVNLQRKRLAWNAVPTIFNQQQDHLSSWTNLPTVTRSRSPMKPSGSPGTAQPQNRHRPRVGARALQTEARMVSQLCRLCATVKSELIPIFGDPGTEMNLVDKIHLHLPIEVKEDDALPLQVCEVCASKLEVCHELVCSSLESQSQLQEILVQELDKQCYADSFASELCGSTVIIDCGTLSAPPQEVAPEVALQDVVPLVRPATARTYSNQSRHLPQATSVGEVQDEGTVDNQHTIHAYQNETHDLSQITCFDQAEDDVGEIIDDHTNLSTAPNVDVCALDDSESCDRLLLPKEHTEPSHPAIEHANNFEQSFTKPDLQTEQLADHQVYDDNDLTASVSNTKVLSCDIDNNKVDELNIESFQQNQCWFCDKCFAERDSLIAHQLDDHPEAVFTCAECDIVIYDKAAYDEHISLHFSLSFNPSESSTLGLQGNTDMQLEAVGTDWKDQMTATGTIDETGVYGAYLSYRAGLRNVEQTSENCGNTTALINYAEENKNMFKNEDGHSPFDSYQLSMMEKSSADQEQCDAEVESTDKEILENQGCIPIDAIYYSDYENHIYIQNMNNDNKDLFGSIDLKTTELSNEEKSPIETTKVDGYNCIVCESDFTTKQDLDQHSVEHGSKDYTCGFCNKSFVTRGKLSEHIRVHTNEKPFNCSKCGRSFRLKASLKSHLYTHSEGEKPYVCDVFGCNKQFVTKSGFKSHRVSHKLVNTFLCDMCGKRFKYKASLFQHKKTHAECGEVSVFSCNDCGKKYKERFRLKEHMRIHTNERPYQCLVCNKQFHKAAQLSQHRLVHSTNRKHECHICNKRFNRLGNMRIHVKRHDRIHRYTCLVCNQPFDSLRDISLHRKTHTKDELDRKRRPPPKPHPGGGFKCEVCGKSLSTKVTLQKHLTLHTGIKPYQCDLCDRSFTVRSNLMNHRVIHSGMKPFPCQYCPVGFMNKTACDVHERNHTGLRPFKCQICGREFRSKMNLNQHFAVHSDFRPFECNYCGKGFRRRDTLEAHIRIHTGVKPYKCSICGRSFTQRGDCAVHERRAHKDHHEKFEMFLADPNNDLTCLLCGIVVASSNELTVHYEVNHADQLTDGSNMIVMDGDSLVSFPEITVGDRGTGDHNFN